MSARGARLRTKADDDRFVRGEVAIRYPLGPASSFPNAGGDCVFARESGPRQRFPRDFSIHTGDFRTSRNSPMPASRTHGYSLDMHAATDFQSDTRIRLMPAVRLTVTGEGATLLDTSTGRIITTNGTASALLSRIRDIAAYDALYATLAGLPDAPAADTVDAELRTFLTGLIEAELVEVVR
jgi:hypothetical protein